MRSLLALVVTLIVVSAASAAEAGVPAADDIVESDRWYVGLLDGQPAVTMHCAIVLHPDGTRSSLSDTSLVFQRTLGTQTLRITMNESQVMDESADGKVTGFRFDRDENGSRTSATGTVRDGAIAATVLRLGRATEQQLTVPADLELLGQQAGQDILAQSQTAIGDSLSFGTILLMGHEVVVTKATSTLLEKRDDGDRLYRVLMEVAPFPSTMLIDAKGELKGMTLDVVMFKIVLKPSDGPVPLLGAELVLTGLITAKGPTPRLAARNRYRADPAALATLPPDAFQSVDGDVVTVATEARSEPEPDTAPLLASEPQLELDDPELRAWVAEVLVDQDAEPAARAERLRLAVRSRIENKDLSKGDGSALEAFRERRGDCTEHANLLCAALRIAGIPARSEIGVVFAPEFGSWVGHAWNSAWFAGAWHHLDSAYPGIPRSCYLRLASSSGGTGTAAVLTSALSAFAGKTLETLAE